MKAFVPIAASLALALAPVAHAQVTCSEVANVNRYGLDDFEEIAEDEIDDDYYDASYYLAGAEECNVDYTLDSIYSCIWVYDSYASASASYSAQISALGSCLSGWQYRTEATDSEAKDGYRTVQAASYEGSGQYLDMAWGVFIEEHTFDGGTDWHLVTGLAYFW